MGRWNNFFDCHYKKMRSDNLLCNGLRMTNDLFPCAQRLFVAESANYIHIQQCIYTHWKTNGLR